MNKAREASEAIGRQGRNAVREAVSARRIQSSTGPMTEKAIDEILFRGSHDIMRALATYPNSVVHAIMPSVVRFMLHSFLEIDASEPPFTGGGGLAPNGGERQCPARGNPRLRARSPDAVRC